MGDTIWLAFQALGTMLIVLVLAFFSYRKTRQMLADRRPRQPSALARAVPDPLLRPDPEVTDPHHVAHGEPMTDELAARRAGAAPSFNRDPEVARAHAASVQHPSGVERLDHLVELAGQPQAVETDADALARRRAAR